MRPTTRSLLRWLPLQFAAKKRLAMWTEATIVEDGEEIQHTVPGTSITFLVDTHDLMQTEMYYFGLYQPEIVATIMQFLRADTLFVDIGANTGQNVVLAADWYRSKGVSGISVLGFEPIPTLYQRTIENLAANNLTSCASVRQVAVSDTVGEAQFYLPDMASNTGTGVLAKDRTYRAGIHTGERLTVETVRLSEELANRVRPVGVIKLDIEGAELLALRGAESILAVDKPVLILEAVDEYMQRFGYSYVDLADFLVGFGYRFFSITPDATWVPLTDQPDGNDILCLPGV
jgi:FkbM family methyltransferase